MNGKKPWRCKIIGKFIFQINCTFYVKILLLENGSIVMAMNVKDHTFSFPKTKNFL